MNVLKALRKLGFKALLFFLSSPLERRSRPPWPCPPLGPSDPLLSPRPSPPLTWTRVHRNIWNLGASATPAARLLPLFDLGEDLGLGDGVV